MKQIGLITFFIALLTCCACGQSDLETKSVPFECYFPPEPTFPCGLDSLNGFIKRNLRYPSGRTDIEGKVFVQFVVDKSGRVIKTKIIRGLCDQCDKNAIEVLEKMPKWFPAKQNGKPVESIMIIPFSFKL